MKSKMKRTMLLVLCFLMVVSFIGCGQASEPSTSNEEAENEGIENESAEGEVFTITMMQELFSAQPPVIDNENPVFSKMTEYTNVKVDVSFVPTSEYTDKVNALIASNDLPMVVAMNGGLKTSNSVVSGAKNGSFWDITDYIQDYPNLYNFIGEERFTNSSIEGRIYGIPRLRVIPRNGMFYRKDWADKLNIDPPQTLDEIYEMARAFTEDDPDGNGVDDTWGFEFGYASTGNRGWNGVQTIAVALGAPNGWGYDSGTMVPDFTTVPYMEALNFFRKLYEDGYMNKDFAVLTGNKRYDVFNQGNAGAIFGVMDDATWVEPTLQQVKPEAELTVAPAILSPDGGDIRVNATSGYNGIIMFNKTGKGAIKNEEDLKKALQYYDDMCSEEMQNLFIYGIEGAHYNVEDGVKVPIYKDDGTTMLLQDIGDIGQLLPLPAFVENESNPRITKEVHAAFNERLDYAVYDPTSALTSPTYTEYGGELDKIIMDASVKYIMGEIDEAGYKKQVDIWRSRGGDKVIEEYAELYKQYFGN
jgi:putative aldouronate transport system substrate-binding protein